METLESAFLFVWRIFRLSSIDLLEKNAYTDCVKMYEMIYKKVKLDNFILLCIIGLLFV